MSEICAYHECGHAVVAVALGGNVHSLSIDPDWDDGPLREGDIEVHWPARKMSESQINAASIQVALAGPAAEMIYTGDPFHPALVQEWSWDWKTAWEFAAAKFPQEPLRLRFLEKTTVELHAFMSRDNVWQAVASLADELLAHEIMEEAEIHEAITNWL